MSRISFVAPSSSSGTSVFGRCATSAFSISMPAPSSAARTAASVPGSVAYLFDKQGVIVVDAERYTEDDLIVAIDAGAEDIAMDDDVFEVITEPGTLTAVRAALDEAGVEVENAEVAQRPKTLVPLDEDGATKLMKLIDALEEQDDVDAVHANFDVPADVLERVAG